MSANFLISLTAVALITPNPASASGGLYRGGSAANQAPTKEIRGGPVVDGVQLFIEAQSAPFHEDQPINVVFHVINVGAVKLDFSYCRSRWDNNFHVGVTTDRGEVVSELGNVGMGSNTDFRIGPGQEHIEIGDLRDQFALEPGKYYVTATADLNPSDGSRSVRAISNTIKIAVIPKHKGGSTKGLFLGLSAWGTYETSDGVVPQGLRLSNSADTDIEVASKQRQAWFHDVTLDLRTLAGDRVRRRRGPDGEELSTERDGSGPYNYRTVIAGPIRAGDHLDGQLFLRKLYDLIPGTAYTLTARLTMQTSEGPVDLTSNTVTFAIKAN